MLKKSTKKLKAIAFDWLGMQEIVERQKRHQLEDSMGFRGQWETHRSFQIDMLRRLGLQPNSQLVEIGCGPMTGGIPIIEYLDAGCYTGVDVRESVLNLAWQEVGEAGLSRKNARLICSSNFAQQELRSLKFDFVFSFSVLFHLDDSLLEGFFLMASSALSSTGKCIVNINTKVPDSTWLEFPFRRRTFEDYAAGAARHGLVTEDLGEISALGFEGAGLEKHNRLLVFRKDPNVRAV